MTQQVLELLIKARSEARAPLEELNRQLGDVKQKTGDAATGMTGFGRSIGAVTVEAIAAQQKVAAIKQLIAETQRELTANPGGPGAGFLAGLAAELDQAVPKLKALQTELKQVEKTSQQTFDGANKSTADWSAGLSGVKSLLAAFGVQFALSSIVQFGAGIVDNVSKIEDLHEATGIASSDLQRLGYIGQGVGMDMDAMGRAVETLATRVAKGDQSAVSAIQALGLNVDELKRKGPLELFLASADAAGELQDPLDKAGIASELFGDKLGTKLLPMLADLRSEMAKVPDKALIPDEDIKAIDDLADAWGRAKTQVEAYFAKKLMASSGPTVQQQLLALPPEKQMDLQGVDRFNSDMSGRMKDYGLPVAAAHVDLLANRLKALRTEAMEPLSDTQKKQILELKEYGESEQKIAELVRSNTLAVHLYVEAHRESLAATKKTNAENERLQKTQADAASSMDTLTGAQIEAIKYYQAQHLGVSEIAKVLEVYEHQVVQVTEAEKDLAKARKAELDVRMGSTLAPDGRVEAYIGGLKQTLSALKQNQTVEEGMRQMHSDKVKQMTLSLFDYQKAKLADWQDNEEGKLDYSVAGWEKAYQQIAEVAKDKLAEIQHAQDMEDVKLRFTFVGPEKPEFNALTASFGQNLKHSFGETVRGIPDTILRALEGGGGLKGAAMSIGSQFGGNLTQSLGNSIAKNLPGMFGEMLGSFIGPLGSMIGPLVGKLFSIGKPSKEELAGRGVEADFEKSMAQYGAAGTSGLSASLSGLQRQYMDVGMGASEAATKAQADFAKLFAAEKQGADAVSKAIRQINADLAAQQGLISGTDPLMQKYGLTWKELSKAQQQAHIAQELRDAQAETKKLIAAGFDQSLVYDRMAKVYGQYVRDVIESGGPIERSMIPALQRLKDMGELVDATGQAISDVDWAKLVHDAKVAADGVNAAMDGIHGPRIDNSGVTGGLPTGDGSGVSDGSGDGMGQAAGGIYASGARGVATWFGEGGQPEVGGPADFFEKIFSKLGVGGKGGGDLNLTINASGMLSASDFVNTVHTLIVPAIHQAYRDNVGGAQTDGRVALAID